MSKLKTQFGVASSADFEDKCWTFDMPEEFSVTAGEFAIVPKDKYDELIQALNSIKNSMAAHPDCEPDSEFRDMVDTCNEALSAVTS